MIRIFVGCSANNEDLESQAVLDYTLHLHASERLHIEWMMQSRDPASFWHGWNTAGWTTPFSGFRWGIPARCEFAGRAIYLDSDMIVMADIAELFYKQLEPGKVVMAKGRDDRFCCTLFDCEAVRPHMLPIERLRREAGAYRQQRPVISRVTQPFPRDENWNCCDGEDYTDLRDPRIKLHHYTAIDTQPQLRHALARLARRGQSHWFAGKHKPHPRKDIEPFFDEHLRAAVKAGYRPENYEREPFGRYAAGTSRGGAWVRRAG